MDSGLAFAEARWCPASLAPIYAAIGLLVAVALAEFTIALWPQVSAPSARGEGGPTAANPAVERKLRFTPDSRPRTLRWM
jgi:hypothetical protein